jgi:multiple sugar transport system permease protein
MPGKGSGQEGRMADGTSLPVGVFASAPRRAGQTGSLKPVARRKSSVAFMLCLPLNLLISAFVDLGNFTFLLKRHTFKLVIFQSCLFVLIAVVMKALLEFIIPHLMHTTSGKCLLASLPPIVIYAFLMDYYVAGLTAGATKG